MEFRIFVSSPALNLHEVTCAQCTAACIEQSWLPAFEPCRYGLWVILGVGMFIGACTMMAMRYCRKLRKRRRAQSGAAPEIDEDAFGIRPSQSKDSSMCSPSSPFGMA